MILLAGLLPALSAATISGTVVAREGSRLAPVFRAEVIAREGGSAEVAAVARTDREGRFLITGLESPKVVLSVQKSRYFTAGINGREDENITLDCTVPADCADIRFELALGGVVSGMVRDEFGEPAGAVHVSPKPAGGTPAEGERPPRAGLFGVETDDRGYFRLFGLKPGRYVLEAERRSRGPMAGGFKGDPVEIEVEERREYHGILITGTGAEGNRQFTVSGTVSGVNLAADGFNMLMVQYVGPRGGFATGSGVRPDGGFTIQNLSAGRYAFHFVPRMSGSIDREDAVPVGIHEIQGDVSGLLLRPLPPTGFSGGLEFESGERPEEVHISASSEEFWRPFTATAKAPDYRFEMKNLIAGTYKLTVFDRRGRGRARGRGAEGFEFYVRGIRRGSELVPARGLALAEGKVDELTVVISSEFSRVYGRVKAAAEGDTGGGIREGAQFQVGLSGPNGYRAVQADQNGRFEFDQVVPGEYSICAWSEADAQAIYDDKAWARAGDAVRKFSVDPGSEVEIDLTAAQ